jgi:hypothetical protein
VATIGPRADHAAIIEGLGLVGSCKCKMSNFPALNQFLVLVNAAGSNLILAMDPLYGRAIVLPAFVA